LVANQSLRSIAFSHKSASYLHGVLLGQTLDILEPEPQIAADAVLPDQRPVEEVVPVPIGPIRVGPTRLWVNDPSLRERFFHICQEALDGRRSGAVRPNVEIDRLHD
jgi:hypothetical protein